MSQSLDEVQRFACAFLLVWQDYLLEIEKQKKLNADVAAVKEDIKRLREEVQKEEQKKTEIQNQLKEMKRARGQAAVRSLHTKQHDTLQNTNILMKNEANSGLGSSNGRGDLFFSILTKGKLYLSLFFIDWPDLFLCFFKPKHSERVYICV